MAQFELGSDRSKVVNLGSLLKRRGFFWPSFEIYGGVSGFYDLGPLGSQLMENIERAWKEKFLIEEGFMLVDGPSLAPEIVFRSSGHLSEFTDVMTKCKGCATPFRADHLVIDLVKDAGTLSLEEMGRAILGNKVRCPSCGGELSPPEEFNLMFKTHIGPGTDKIVYLRPETAQTIFMDFPLLYRTNRERMPFGVGQMGRGFRNEISPRQGLLRQREFRMAEGEFFYDPAEKGFPPFKRYRDLKVMLLPNIGGEETFLSNLGDAVKEGTIGSEILAHFMGATYSFVGSLGIPPEQMRFREHRTNEMAHYARDCWDLEVMTSFGWVEMVGIADRSAYDLDQHSIGSGQVLKAMRRFQTPKKVRTLKVKADMKMLGPVFKGEAKTVGDAVSSLDPGSVREALERSQDLKVLIDGTEVMVPSKAISLVETEETLSGEWYTPHVVEPSFGLDRLMVAVLEHSYHEEAKKGMDEEEDAEDEGPYRYLRFLPSIAPVKVGVLPLMNREPLAAMAAEIDTELRTAGMQTFHDASGSIGRRYARMDEIGTPFCVTVDFDSPDGRDVTIRERDTGAQRRVRMTALKDALIGLLDGTRSMSEL